jgi:hypothetical protein
VVYGLLSAHCADETGKEGGYSIVKKGDEVKYVNSEWKEKDKEICGIDFNEYLKKWSVLDSVD